MWKIFRKHPFEFHIRDFFLRFFAPVLVQLLWCFFFSRWFAINSATFIRSDLFGVSVSVSAKLFAISVDYLRRSEHRSCGATRSLDRGGRKSNFASMRTRCRSAAAGAGSSHSINEKKYTLVRVLVLDVPQIVRKMTSIQQLAV